MSFWMNQKTHQLKPGSLHYQPQKMHYWGEYQFDPSNKGNLMILVKHLLKQLEQTGLDVYAPVKKGQAGVVFGSVSGSYVWIYVYFEAALIFCNSRHNSCRWVGDSWCNILRVESFWVIYRFQSRDNVWASWTKGPGTLFGVQKGDEIQPSYVGILIN